MKYLEVILKFLAQVLLRWKRRKKDRKPSDNPDSKPDSNQPPIPDDEPARSNSDSHRGNADPLPPQAPGKDTGEAVNDPDNDPGETPDPYPESTIQKSVNLAGWGLMAAGGISKFLGIGG